MRQLTPRSDGKPEGAHGQEVKFSIFRQAIRDANEGDLRYVETLVQARRNKIVEEERVAAQKHAEHRREKTYRAAQVNEKGIQQ